MSKSFAKGLLMTLITLLATTFTTTGMPHDLITWQILGITTFGTVLTYLAKNYIFPSISVLGTIDLRDVLSGLILALGSGISSFAAESLTVGVVNWSNLFSLMLTVSGSYLASKFATDPNKVR